MSKQSLEKLMKSLGESSDNRKSMLLRFGFIPMSILKISRGKLSKKVFNYVFDAETNIKLTKNNPKGKEMQDRLKAAGYKGKGGGKDRGVSKKESLSVMPAELVEFFIKYYSKPGDVYLDPFMGQGVQMQVAKMLGLHYYGYDLSFHFFKYIDSVRKRIDNNKTIIDIHHGDSKFPTKIPDEIGDFSFHSPPYWDIEDYGNDPEQLGKGKTYQEFLDGMEAVARAWLPKFKKGAYHVVNVNDFRRKGKFYSYHSDTINLFVRAGWELVDTWVIEGLVGGLPMVFGVKWNLRKIAPKTHEYALVFRRPLDKEEKKKGKK